MKYNYCPICGEKLPKHHIGKLCKTCARKQFKKQAIKTVLLVGLAAGAGTAAYFYVKDHKKETAAAASKLAGQALALQAKKLEAEQKLLLEAARRASQLKYR